MLPTNCPGTESESAGKSSACEGCPNQKICASGGLKEVDPDLPLLLERMSCIEKKVLILSGKGGVGKSSVSCQLALTLAEANPDLQIGLLDVDICGPSVPCMMGVEQESVHQSNAGWTPVFVRDNLSVMSVGFLLDSKDDAVIWRGPKKNGIIKQFIRDVDWGDLDILLIDTPPGTSDEHLSIVKYLLMNTSNTPAMENGVSDGMSESSVSSTSVSALMVSTPQKVALADVAKEIDFCRKVKLPVLGIVENMAGFVCQKCKKSSDVFKRSSSPPASHLLDLPILASIPLDPRLARACDSGLAIVTEAPESLVSLQYKHLASQLLNKIGL